MTGTADLARHVEAEARIATALVDLERHPGYQALVAGRLSGHTAERWAVARALLADLWADFAQHRAATAAAGAVLGRRARPGAAEQAQLRHLLVEPTIEASRTPVALADRGIAGPAEHVETVTLTQLRDRMDAAFREVSELVVTCDVVRRTVLDTVGPLAEQLRTARDLLGGLGLGPDAPDAITVARLTDRLAEVERLRLDDPLTLAGRVPADGGPLPELTDLATDVLAATARFRELDATRADWDRRLSDLGAELTALDVLARDEAEARRRAAELIAAAGLTRPPVRPDHLRHRLAGLTAPVSVLSWPDRVAALTKLGVAVRDAADELRAATATATGLVERRRDLRGRFEAYQAKAVRLGLAERPELLATQQRLRDLLWTSPCDLAAATRELRDYQALARGGAA